MKAFGVVRYSPEQIVSGLLKKFKLEMSDIMFVGVGENLSKIKRFPKVIMFLNFQDFLNNARILNETKHSKRLVFCFAPAEKLFGYDGINVIDVSAVELPRFIKFEENPIDWNFIKTVKSKEVSRATAFIDSVKESVKQGSILNELMTVIYTIKKPHNQKGTTLYICRWLVEKKIRKIPELIKQIRKDFELTGANVERLVNALSNSNVKQFKKVFLKLKEDHSNLEELCNRYGIPPFEVRYILAKIANEKGYSDKSKRNIDELVDS